MSGDGKCDSQELNKLIIELVRDNLLGEFEVTSLADKFDDSSILAL